MFNLKKRVCFDHNPQVKENGKFLIYFAGKRFLCKKIPAIPVQDILSVRIKT
jgi:hypothetical protein